MFLTHGMHWLNFVALKGLSETLAFLGELSIDAFTFAEH